MGTNTGSIELKPDYNVELYEASYSTGEDSTLLGENSIIDAGTVDCSTGDNVSTEVCAYLKCPTDKVYNLKAFISNYLPGVKAYMKVSAASLSGALEAAGSAVAYTDEAKGFIQDGTSVTFTPATTHESNRIQWQYAVTKTSFGVNPYDPDKDALIVPSTLWLYWEEDDYKQRIDTPHGRIPSDVFKNRKAAELFYVNELGYVISMGDITDDSSVTWERTTEISEIQKGYPKRTLMKTLDSSSYMLSGNLEIDDNAITAMIKNHALTYDATSGMYKTSGKDTVNLVRKKFVCVIYTVDGYIRILEIPAGDITISGSQNLGAAESPVPFEITANPDAVGNYYYDWHSPAPASFVGIDTKFAVTLS